MAVSGSGASRVAAFSPVQGLEGVYFASQLDTATQQLRSLITFDIGGKWERIAAPAGTPCADEPCGLHLHLQAGTVTVSGLHIPSLLALESAPGFILANGNVGKVPSAPRAHPPLCLPAPSRLDACACIISSACECTISIVLCLFLRTQR